MATPYGELTFGDLYPNSGFPTFSQLAQTAPTVAAVAPGRLANLRNLKLTGLTRFGPAAAGFTAGGLLQDNAGGARDYAANIARGAGIGATVGSFVPLPGATLFGAGLGGLGGALYEYFDEDTGRPVSGGTIPLPTPQQRMSPEQVAELYNKYMGAGTGGGGMVSAAQDLNRREMQILRNYWNNLNQYGQNRAQALRDLFSGTSAARIRAGQATERAGTNLAADIENLYARLGQQVSQPMVAPESPTAGLAPVSGSMATAAQTIPSEGANLANYLAAATGAEAGNIYDIGTAQALQGAAMSQGFLDTLNMAQQQAIAAQRTRNANRVADARASASAAASARTNALNNLLLEYELEGITEGNRQRKSVQDATIALGYIRATQPEQYKNIQKVAKQFQGNPTPEQLIQTNPELINLFLGGE